LASENDILLIVTTKDADAMAQEMDIPANVRIAAFIPHQELLKHVDVMVTNGGYGGVLTALSMGVPLIGAGLTEDKTMVNARIAWSGAGVDLKTDRPSEEQIRRAVRKVLHEKTYAEKARGIQEDFAKYPGPKNACDALEEPVERL
jgi:UDP:flavonoid glycosyltransferase YjiC (YdhE family)